MKFLLFLFSLIFIIKGDTKVFPTEARAQAEYLNKFRQNPNEYGKKIGLNLDKVKTQKALVWDTILAKTAQEKAERMATDDFFGHVEKNGNAMNYYVNKAGYTLPLNWLNKKSNNYVESISANSTGTFDFINQLIIDKGVSNLGHRVHLLSMSDFYAQNTHIGIGIAYNPNSTYKYYFCLLMAPPMVKK